VLTSLRGSDGQVYAIAQGPVMTGGFSSGKGGSAQTVNHPTVGRGVGAATVERGAPSVAPSGTIHLQVRQSDFTTTTRIVEAVNQKFKAEKPPAHADNAGLGEGWQRRRHQNGSCVGDADRGGRHGNTHSLEQVGQALGRKQGLAAVARPGETDDQPVANQLVIAYALDRNQIFQAGGPCRIGRCVQQKQ